MWGGMSGAEWQGRVDGAALVREGSLSCVVGVLWCAAEQRHAGALAVAVLAHTRLPVS